MRVERWGIYETELKGPRTGNPFTDVELSATFRCMSEDEDTSVTVPGFYDGNGVYKVRFMPRAVGEWSFSTVSNSAELDDRSGSFECTAPSADNHGPVRVRNTFHFAYTDGTPYHPFGTTCYAWAHQSRDLQEQTLKTLSASPFNKIRFCVFPKSYVYNRNEPEFFAFQKGESGQFDFNQPNPTFWRPFEKRSRGPG